MTPPYDGVIGTATLHTQNKSTQQQNHAVRGREPFPARAALIWRSRRVPSRSLHSPSLGVAVGELPLFWPREASAAPYADSMSPGPISNQPIGVSTFRTLRGGIYYYWLCFDYNSLFSYYSERVVERYIMASKEGSSFTRKARPICIQYERAYVFCCPRLDLRVLPW